MDPSNKETPAIPLPSPVEQTAAAGLGAAEGSGVEFERAPGAAEQPPAGLQAPALQATTIPLPMPAVTPTAQPPAISGPSSTAAPTAASDDKGLIEKEWVEKAKRIVERNRNDPYKQSEELTVFKADYLKKRYGKTIKVSQ